MKKRKIVLPLEVKKAAIQFLFPNINESDFNRLSKFIDIEVNEFGYCNLFKFNNEFMDLLDELQIQKYQPKLVKIVGGMVFAAENYTETAKKIFPQ